MQGDERQDEGGNNDDAASRHERLHATPRGLFKPGPIKVARSQDPRSVEFLRWYKFILFVLKLTLFLF